MTNYEIREYESQTDNRHHIDIYADTKIQNSYTWDGAVWIEKNTQKGTMEASVQDIIENEVYGDLDEYNITEQNVYGVKYTYYRP